MGCCHGGIPWLHHCSDVVRTSRIQAGLFLHNCSSVIRTAPFPASDLRQIWCNHGIPPWQTPIAKKVPSCTLWFSCTLGTMHWVTRCAPQCTYLQRQCGFRHNLYSTVSDYCYMVIKLARRITFTIIYEWLSVFRDLKRSPVFMCVAQVAFWNPKAVRYGLTGRTPAATACSSPGVLPCRRW